MIENLFNNKNFKSIRFLLILINDIFILNISLYLSYFLRVEYFLEFNDIINVSVISSFIYLILFFIFNLYKQYYRYFSFSSGQLYLKIYILFGLFFGFYVLYQSQNFIPRSLILIFPTFFFLLIIINRFLVANLFEFYTQKKKKAVVFGFNPTNINALLSYAKITCFVDDKNINTKRIINGIKILSTKEFNLNFDTYTFNLILIENDVTFNKSKYYIRKHLFERKILVQKISSKKNEIITSSYFDFNYFFNRKNKISSLGDTYKTKVVLITGAGGSIGSNIVFQLLQSKYKKIFLLDKSEYNLYEISNKISNKKNIIFLLKNFNNKNDMEQIIIKNKIDIIFHAAAYKHVPLIELNPFSAIKNNFLDTFELMKLSSRLKVSNFCLISSDKAVRPTNIMGATKRLSELALAYLNNLNANSTKFCSVRFGNVINSSGSVKPLFQYQIDNNLPITLTHKKIIRYFMTIEEAANLVLNTIKISSGGEVFLLDMGKSIKLYDLAKLMIQFSGKTLKQNGIGDIDIKIIGLRKGEKLYEELLIDQKSKETKINSIYQSLESNIKKKEFLEILSNIQNHYNNNDISKLKKALKNKFINYLPLNEK